MPNLPKTKSAGTKRGASATSKKAKGKKGSKSSSKKNKVAPLTLANVDILSPAAMLNLQYISHNCPDALTMRGFPYTGPKAKKKKGGKGGKKKKKK